MTCFFDTCWLRRAYLAGKLRRSCRRVLTRNSGDVFIAEITMLEMVSALSSELREGKIQKADYTAALDAFQDDVADGRIRVRPFGIQDGLASRALLHHVGVELGRHLKTQDAMVASTARELALQLQSRVRFYTCDQKLAKTLKAIDVFRPLDVRYFQP